MRRSRGSLISVVLLTSFFMGAGAGRAVDYTDCAGPSGEAANSFEFYARDWANLRCSEGRFEDQVSNPALAYKGALVTPAIYTSGLTWQVQNPSTPSITASRLLPGLATADPFRTPAEWVASGRGRIEKISFTSSYTGTMQAGELFLPPAAGAAAPWPGVVLTTGGTQASRHLYYWAAEGLAENGYMVLSYDVPTQGDSQTFRNDEHGVPIFPPRCFNDPFPSGFQFFEQDCLPLFQNSVKDALNFFLSTANPQLSNLNTSRIGLAGHSIGASWSQLIGQSDSRVKAVVSWDSTGYYPQDVRAVAHAPSLTIASDYPSTRGPAPESVAPNPFDHSQGHIQLTCTNGYPCNPSWPLVDSMQVGLRAGTRYEWAYLPYAPYPRTASRYGERVSFYYTLAWFDAYLKGLSDAFRRLTARAFDVSADASSIGAGTFGGIGANGAPINSPNMISGLSVGDRLSFYYRSHYRLKIGAGELRCDDLRLNRKFEGSDAVVCDSA